MVTNDGGIPLLQHTVTGNTNDNAHFGQVLKTLQHNIAEGDDRFYAILDSAFYSKRKHSVGRFTDYPSA